MAAQSIDRIDPLLSPTLGDELAAVRGAVEYFERFAEVISASVLGDKVARYYGVHDSTSRRILRFKALFFATRIEPVLRFVANFRDTHGRAPRMLDLGCGYGLETTLLAAAGADITGMDYAATKVETAQAAASLLREISGGDFAIPYLQGDIKSYVPEQTFDAIYSSATLHHIEPVQLACTAIANALAPSGSFFLSDENGLNPVQQLLVQQRIGWLQPRVLQRTDPITSKVTPYGNENIRPAFLWNRYLRRAGLEPAGIKYCRFLPPLDLDVEALLRTERLLRRVPFAGELTAIGFVAAFHKP